MVGGLCILQLESHICLKLHPLPFVFCGRSPAWPIHSHPIFRFDFELRACQARVAQLQLKRFWQGSLLSSAALHRVIGLGPASPQSNYRGG